MKYAPKSLLLLVPLVLWWQAAPGLPSPPEPTVTVSGALTGRASRGPLAKAWVCLGRLTKDEEGKDADLLLTQLTAVTDEKGNFQIKGVPAGSYTLVYRPAPAAGAKSPPAKGAGKISVRKLAAGIRSFMPMIRDREVGVSTPFDERPWPSPEWFTLLKGHTLYCIPLGSLMKIWNASIRSGRQGPYLEMRKNQIWRQDFQKDTQIKFEAWSF